MDTTKFLQCQIQEWLEETQKPCNLVLQREDIVSGDAVAWQGEGTSTMYVGAKEIEGKNGGVAECEKILLQ